MRQHDSFRETCRSAGERHSGEVFVYVDIRSGKLFGTTGSEKGVPRRLAPVCGVHHEDSGTLAQRRYHRHKLGNGDPQYRVDDAGDVLEFTC